MNLDVLSTLEALDVEFTLKPHAEPALTCESAAQQRDVRISQIVKCMVAETENKQLVVMLIPGDRLLKSSKARKFVGCASLDLVPPSRLVHEHGLTVGAISPIQLMDSARMLMDPTVLDEALVDISSGDPLLGVELRSTDLREVVGAELVEMISKNQ